MGSGLRTGFRVLAVGAAVLALGVVARADPHDHDAARRAVQAGEIRPLTDILDSVRDKLPGQIVGVKIERESGRWDYEFRVIDREGRLFDVHVDARSGAIGRIKEK